MRALLLVGLAALASLQAQPRAQAFTLPNGLRVVHLEDREHPLVRARLQVEFQPDDFPQGRRALPQLFLRVLSRSDAADLRKEAFQRLVDDAGVQLHSALDDGGLSWHLVARSRDQDRAFGLLADRVQRSLLEGSVLEAQRMARWREEERQEAHPYLRLRQTLAQGPEAPLPQADLAAITLEDLLQLQARLLRPERAVLVLHGDLGLEQAKRLVRLNLGTWTGDPRPEPPAGPTPSAHPAPQDPGRIPTRSPGFRAQALAPGPPDLSPEAAALLGLLLTGAPPLLPLELSVEGRNLLATVDAWNGASGVATWSLLGERLEALRRRSFTQAELDQARSAWRSRRSLDSLYPEAQMEAALAQARGRALSPERMQALSPEALQAALRVWLAPARLRVGAAGPPEALKALPAP